jgi:hypothetical protein
MNCIHSERLIRWVRGALIALSLYGSFAPRAASAACNHRVVSQSDRLLNLNRLDPLIVGYSSFSTSTSFGSGPIESRNPQRPARCSGLACSGKVPLPMQSESSASDGSDHWLFQNARLHLAGASPPERTIEKPLAHTTAEGPSIFRPPPV